MRQDLNAQPPKPSLSSNVNDHCAYIHSGALQASTPVPGQRPLVLGQELRPLFQGPRKVFWPGGVPTKPPRAPHACTAARHTCRQVSTPWPGDSMWSSVKVFLPDWRVAGQGSCLRTESRMSRDCSLPSFPFPGPSAPVLNPYSVTLVSWGFGPEAGTWCACYFDSSQAWANC